MEQEFASIQEKLLQDLLDLGNKLQQVQQVKAWYKQVQLDYTGKNLIACLNKYKKDLLLKLKQKKALEKEIQIAKKIEDTILDLTIPVANFELGSLHPITKVKQHAVKIMQQMGFQQVEYGEVETEYYNFDALNIGSFHPARQEIDTFYLKLPCLELMSKFLLRTHTSSMQIHYLEQNALPAKIFTIGKVYRCDLDATHTPMFHQLEVLYVDKKATLLELLARIYSFLCALLEKQDLDWNVRISHFPFTEPSLEIDIKVEGKWLEIMGAGLVHPTVLENLNIDSKKHHGYAWGIGIDRITMIKYGITNLKEVFINDLRWLKYYA